MEIEIKRVFSSGGRDGAEKTRETYLGNDNVPFLD